MTEKKIRTRIPKENKIRAELQKEIISFCPFCDNSDVGHFEIHYIDERDKLHHAIIAL
jgi:NADPH-dependent 7-cyano-7-deazaguanine reductase QueF